MAAMATIARASILGTVWITPPLSLELVELELELELLELVALPLAANVELQETIKQKESTYKRRGEDSTCYHLSQHKHRSWACPYKL